MKIIRPISFIIIFLFGFFVLPSLGMAATSPTATIFTPSSASYPQNWTLPFSGLGTVNAIAPTSGTKIGAYGTGLNPIDVTFDTVTNSIWVANYYGASVTRKDPPTGNTTGTYPTPYPLFQSNFYPDAIAFDPITKSILAFNFNSFFAAIPGDPYSPPNIAYLNPASGAKTADYGATSLPSQSVTDSFNNTWMVSPSMFDYPPDTNSVDKYNPSWQLVDNYLTGSGSFNVIFDSSTNSIWTSNRYDNSLTNRATSDA